MGYIKSYGNYVIQKKHKLLNNGTIFERDYATIGGINDDLSIDTKYYRHGTFVFQQNTDQIYEKKYNKNSWEKNGENDFWSKESLNNIIKPNNSLKISLKKDIYKLKDFAYYGSCSELIRSSINDIINKFPGELYVTSAKLLKKDGTNNNVTYKKSEDEEIELYVIDNPFNIDVYSELYEITEENNNIKYFLSNYNNYELYGKNEYKDVKEFILYLEDINPISSVTKVSFISEENSEECPPHFLYKIIINESFNIYCYMDEDNKIYYLTEIENEGKHIKPKQNFYDNFINNLDNFQQILLNQESTPKYSAIFELLKETENGYEIFFEKFTFPLSKYGDYNLDITSEIYYNYINSLSNYGAFFDNLSTNNLYRQFTHESIKNFDWTDTLNRGEETKEEYNENGETIQKIINLFGREFDEIKFYIDGIKNSNNITYNDSNNLPDYFLTDTINLEGWDVKNVFPFTKVDDYFKEDINLSCYPYANIVTEECSLMDSYFSGYWDSDCKQSRIIDNENIYKIDNKGFLREKIRPYNSDKLFNAQEMNNKFMKHLKLNSRHILQKKGTIEAIESLLSLFGLRSKRWYDSLEQNTQKRLFDELMFKSDDNIPYDYEIKEYVTISEHMEDKDNIIEFFNSTKDITYPLSNNDNPYIGLPVKFYEIIDDDNKIKRLLYPYFSNEIDGNPYFQMNGGWIHKDFNFSGSTLIIDEKGGYLDTFTQISSVNDFNELFNLNYDLLYDGLIYYVKNVKGNFLLIDRKLYNIEYNESNKPYINIEIIDNELKIGDYIFYGEIKTYDDNYEIITVNLNNLENHTLFKLFINNEGFVHISKDDYFLTNYQIINDGNLLNNEIVDNLTNYYVLRNKNWSHILSWGWDRLKTSDNEYKTIKNIRKNNLGNNPHANCLKYDNGINYVKYFHNLFKYAIDNELIKQNCYDGLEHYLNSLYEMKNNVGFNNLIIETDECDEIINLYEDSKIHNFCDIITKNENDEQINKFFYELTTPTDDYSYNLYNHKDYEFLNNDEILCGSSSYSCLNQIINLKNIDIIFYYLDEYIKDELGKNLNENIIHYLSQIIPSNIILNIKIKPYNNET